MNEEIGVVLIKRKVDGVDAPVRLDQFLYDENPEAYELWEDKKTQGKKDIDILKAPEGTLIIGKNGKSGRGSKFVILNDQGEKAIDDEFATEAEAFEAMTILLTPAA